MALFAANALIVFASFLAMEALAWAVHRYIMHGWGWGWHRSHHEPRKGWFETNDLYAVVFSALTLVLLWLSSQNGYHPIYFVGVGTSLYGAAYFILHDVLVHGRVPLRWTPKRGYLKRLVQAHRLHHATRGREGAVSFGFLYAPPVRSLKAQLQARGVSARNEP
jgi:beta-carotene 3-hydroxylase